MADDGLLDDFRRFKSDGELDTAHGNLLAARGEDPEAAARYNALAKRWGVGMDAAKTQTPMLEQAARTQADQSALAEAPGVTRFLAKDPAHAAVTHDHVTDLATTETFAKRVVDIARSIPAALSSAPLSIGEGTYGALQAYMEATGQTKGAAAAQRARLRFRAGVEKRTPKGGNIVSQGIFSGVQSAGMMAPSIAIGLTQPEVGLGIMVAPVAGQAYGEARDKGKDVGTSLRYGASQGGAEYLTERLPFHKLIGDVVGKAPFWKTLRNQLATEIPGELGATLLQGFDQWMTLDSDTKSFGQYLEGLPADLAQTVIATATTVGAATGAVHTLDRAASRLSQKDAQAQAAPDQLKAFDELAKQAASLPLRERSPEAFQALMEDLTPGVDVHVNAQVLGTYLQSLKPEEAQALVASTGIADQLAAATPEADIVIPAATYLTQIAPTEGHAFLQKDIKLGPAGMSVNEAEAHKGEREQMLAEAATRALGNAQSGDASAAERVRQDFYDQSILAGVPEEQAKANAAIQAAYYTQRANRNTTYADAWEAYQAAGVSIQGPNAQPATGGDVFSLFKQPDRGTVAGIPDQLLGEITSTMMNVPSSDDGSVQIPMKAEEITTLRAAGLEVSDNGKLTPKAALALMDERYARNNHPTTPGAPAATFEQRPTPTAKDLVTEVPGLKKVLPYLTDEERAKLKKQNAKALVAALSKLPSAEEMASVAYAGRAKRGWYEKSAKAILNVFGAQDAPRFAALLAALSPQTSVESNLFNALATWVNWDGAGRPTDRRAIIEVLGQSVQGGKGVGSVLDAWINNSVRALSTEDPGGITLSGPKVNSFMNNLIGVVDEVTNDAWMANYALIDQAMFKGKPVKGGDEHGFVSEKGNGYMAMSALVRKAAEVVSTRTGETWTPAEVQETVWSWAKTLYEKRDSMGETTAGQLLEMAGLTHEDLSGTPDFAVLFTAGVYRRILEEGGYGEEIQRVAAGGRPADGSPGAAGSVFSGEGSGIAEPAYQRHLLRAARRIEQRRYAAREARFEQGPTPDAKGLITLSHFSSKGRLPQLDPAMWGENWEVLPDAEKSRVGEAPGRVYWGVGTGRPGEYQPEFGIGEHRYETQVPLDRLYNIDQDPQGLRAQATAEVVAEDNADGQGSTAAELQPEITTRFEQKIKDAGYLGYISDNPELGMVAATFEPVKHTYKGRDRTGAPAEIKDFSPRNLKSLLDRTNWSIMTAENPGAEATPERNLEYNAALEAELKQRGLEYHKVEGHYGQPESSFIVLGISETEALALGQKFGQESVLTRRGLVYADGTYQPAEGITVHKERPEDYYTVVPETGGIFTVDINFNEKLDLPGDPTMHQGPKGQVTFTDQGALVQLFKSRNASTLIHEAAGHVWLDNLAKDAADPNASEEVRADLELVKQWWRANLDQAVTESGGKGALKQSGELRAVTSPTGARLEALLKKAQHGLRGLLDNQGKIHVWDANDATHFDAAQRLGIEYGAGRASIPDNRIWVEMRDGVVVMDVAEDIKPEQLGPYLKDKNVYFDVGSYGLLSGPELAAHIAEGETPVLNTDVFYQNNPKGGGSTRERLAQAIDDYGVKDVAVDDIRPFHEMFARAAEGYFMEGRSPTEGLRGVFARLRQWLVDVYKELSRLQVPMSDDIRGVFDRLIAVPEALDDAQVEQGLDPFFKDPASAGMTPAEYAAYLNTIKIADDAAHDRLLGKVMGDIRRTRTAAWKAEREALVADHQEAVDALPEMQALTLLESGEVRLQREAVQDLGFDEAQLYRRQRPYVFDEGLHPDVVAEQVGLSSGKALLDALVGMKAEHDALRANDDKRTVRRARAEELADAEMLIKHGDVLNDGTIGDEAVAALNDIRRSEVLVAEVRALVRKAGAITAVWSEEEMQAWAKRQIAGRKLSGIQPHVYRAAEAKAGRDALKALVKDDFAAALDAKFRQLLNMHLYRVARDAREEITKGKALFERVVQARNGTISKSRNMDMVETARAILAPYGFGSARNDADYMAKVKQYDPELWGDIEQGVTAALAGGRPVDELNYDEFVSLRTMVDQLWRMSRVSRQMEIDFQTLEVEDIANDLGDRLGAVEPQNTARAPTNTEHAMRLVAGVRAALRRVESWATGLDGGNKGPWRTYIWNPVSEAATRYRNAKADYLTRFVALLEPIQAGLKRGKIDAPELGYTFGFANSGVGKGELLHAVLHTGNESNKRKLLLGRGWALEQADGTLDTSRWDAFMSRMQREGVLTKADFDFAQSVWDLLEEMKPAAQKAHRQVFGRYFEEVTANSFSTTYGTYRGGYVPAIVDTFLVQEQALNAQADAITDANDAAMFPSPARGFTKSRVEYNRPLALDLGLLPAHIDKVLKFTHMTAPVRDVLRLLKEKGLSAKLEAFDPVAVPDLLLPWLNRAAKQVVETPSKGNAGKAADKFFRAMRTRTGMGIMIGNVSNTLQQFAGWFPAALKVRKRYLTTGLVRYLKNPAQMAEDVATMSPYMATRVTAQAHEAQANIEQLLLDPSKYEKVSKFAQKHAYIMQSATQNIVDLVTWNGAFEQAIAGGEDFSEAVRFADAAIRETQGSLAPEDISRFETGSPFVRMFTQFYNYFGAQSNLLTTEFKNAPNMTRVGYVYIMGIMLPAVVADAIRRSFGPGWDDDDDDGYLDMWLDTFFGSQFRYATGMVPIVGQLVNLAVNRADKKPYNDQLVPAPAFSSLQQVAGIPRDLYKLVTEGKNQKATVRDTATLFTLLTGVPWFNAAARPLGYLADVNEGKVEPTSNADLARGLVTGTASEASRVP